MSGKLIRRSMIFVMLASVAFAQGAAAPPASLTTETVWSMSDYGKVPSSEDLECPGQGAAPRAAMPAGKGAPSPAEAIKMLESALAQIPPSHPAHAQIQANLDKLRKASQAPKVPKAEENLPSVGSTTPVSLRQALGTLEAALEGTVSTKDLQALEGSDEAKDARGAEQMAVAAMASGKVLAALALELRARRLEPNNPAHLVNLSGLANHYGLWQESLAMADAAGALGAHGEGAMGIPQQAALLNNRAHALLNLGRAGEAEVLLRQAITLAPLLAEARTNLAVVLGKQNKCKEVARFLRAGKWRNPPKDMVLELNPERGQVVEEVTRKPLDELVDLKRGEPGRLPQLKYGLAPEEVKAAEAWYTREEERVKELLGSAGRRFGTEAMNAMERLRQLASSPDLEDRWTGRIADRIYGDVHGGMPGRDLPRRFDELTAVIAQYMRTSMQLELKYLERDRASMEMLAQRTDACSGTCSARALAEHHERMCAATKAWTKAWRQPMQELDAAVRDYHREHHRALTALYAYLSEPALVRAAGARIAIADGVDYANIISPVAEHMRELANRIKACEELPPSAFDLTGYEEANPQECKPGKSKPKAKAVVLEVSFTCEQVEFEVATPGWLAGFVNVGYQFSKRYERLTDPKERFLEKQAGRDPDRRLVLQQYGHAFGGQLTVTAGGKASAVGSVGMGEFATVGELSAKGGMYVSVNGGGEIVDVGMKVDTSRSMGVEWMGVGAGVEISGPSGQVSFVSSE